MRTSRSAKSDWTVNLESASDSFGSQAELTSVLAEFPTASAAIRVAPFFQHGGLSGAQLWRVETLDTSFALRKWPAEYPSAERLRFIHSVLDHVYRQGFVLVPVPIANRSGGTFVERQGRLWELAPWLPGEASFEREPNRTKIAAAMRSLAEFHLASASFGETRLRGVSPGLIDRGKRIIELDARAIDLLRQAIETVAINPAIDGLARTLLTSLPSARAVAWPLVQRAIAIQLPLQPCLRDIWHGNLLFTGDEVTGIVDFGAMQIDSPALDVARLLGSMAGDDAENWEQGLKAYEESRSLTAEDHVVVRASDASGIVLGCVNWLRWLYVERRQFGDLSAVEMRIKSLAPRLRHLART